MKYQDVQKMAKALGINSFGMKKTDLIRAIQRKEENPECYGTERVEYCRELSCLWRQDCIALQSKPASLEAPAN
ncbi:MAG TPA: hypothetical protein PLR20_12250 [Syntrophales bacterium]|nr:hypothetical protein [Syntrophales bacterium]HOX94341.1 hypothetical protein [Syntrophales bacterium]HPI57087.1 hypothetical protein [Syntrophales bacterium]HPN24826.1 hypothetical protein [Syntrophales bacterium]HQM30113.1 hypothetical protein [Syntrophales bacterium]